MRLFLSGSPLWGRISWCYWIGGCVYGLTLVVLLTAASWVMAAEALQLLAVEEPPASYTDSDGRISGYVTDIVREIQRRTGNDNTIRIVPEQRALELAQEQANVVLFGFSKTPLRELNFHLIAPVLSKSWVLYGRKDSGLTLESLEDFKGLAAIGVVRGDIRAEYLQQHQFLNLNEVSRHEHNVKKLYHHRIDALFYEPLGLADVCANLSLPLLAFEPLLTVRRSEVYIMMSRWGTTNEMVEQWQSAAREMQQDGTFEHIARLWADKIYQRYGVHSEIKDGMLNF
ncbi:substrate-binding periplasmic protein [Candidatus Thalassolituus haligoni]|uniref:substrate-binding periplasmic protein n=1 Tax=Candidatus Thalassolituus haligoni TaxID=3100113 RepID=UPI00351431BE|tara:strand:- start:8903 stop:9757 length:855 start_codon:yes stop_codon:yes gene_type:complete